MIVSERFQVRNGRRFSQQELVSIIDVIASRDVGVLRGSLLRSRDLNAAIDAIARSV